MSARMGLYRLCLAGVFSLVTHPAIAAGAGTDNDLYQPIFPVISDRGDSRVLLVNADNLRANRLDAPERKTAIVLSVFLPPLPMSKSYEHVAYAKQTWRVDCNKRTFTSLSTRAFLENDSELKLVSAPPGAPKRVPNESVAAMVLNYICAGDIALPKFKEISGTDRAIALSRRLLIHELLENQNIQEAKAETGSGMP